MGLFEMRLGFQEQSPNRGNLEVLWCLPAEVSHKKKEGIENWNREVKGEGDTRESQAESKECGIGWSGKGSFGPYKVTLLQAHNAGKLLPPQIWAVALVHE